MITPIVAATDGSDQSLAEFPGVPVTESTVHHAQCPVVVIPNCSRPAVEAG
jgi:hypothetical protein